MYRMNGVLAKTSFKNQVKGLPKKCACYEQVVFLFFSLPGVCTFVIRDMILMGKTSSATVLLTRLAVRKGIRL